jgi:hypothetical protein
MSFRHVLALSLALLPVSCFSFRAEAARHHNLPVPSTPVPTENIVTHFLAMNGWADKTHFLIALKGEFGQQCYEEEHGIPAHCNIFLRKDLDHGIFLMMRMVDPDQVKADPQVAKIAFMQWCVGSTDRGIMKCHEERTDTDLLFRLIDGKWVSEEGV